MISVVRYWRVLGNRKQVTEKNKKMYLMNKITAFRHKYLFIKGKREQIFKKSLLTVNLSIKKIPSSKILLNLEPVIKNLKVVYQSKLNSKYCYKQFIF